MPILYKTVAKGEPGVAGGGQTKYYARSVASKSCGLEEISKEIEKISTVSEADIMAVLTALVNLIPEKLANSETVRLGEVGSFRTSVSSQGHEEEKDVKMSSIKSNKVLFNPGQRIKKALKAASYRKVS